VATRLRSGGKFVVSIRQMATSDADNRTGGLNTSIDLGSFNPLERAGKRDIALMFRQVAVLLSSGVSIVQAFRVLERQSRKRGMKRLLKRLQLALECGESLSDAMTARGRSFSPFMISMVRAAEMSGELDTIMEQIADQLEASMEFRRTMLTSMIYPALVIVMTVVAIGVLTLVVIPKFMPLLAGAGQKLPWATKVVVDITKWVQLHAKSILMGFCGLLIAIPLARKTAEGGYLTDWLRLKLPFIGTIVKCGMVVNFSRNLAILFGSGVSISDALATVRDTLRNHVGARVVDTMITEIEQGGSMAAPLLAADHIFPPMVGEMLATSEETGEVEKALQLTARIHQKMLENSVNRMNAMIEPLLIVVLGSIVGFVFYALISGMLAAYGV
jgi:type II secretory pathway component PulF